MKKNTLLIVIENYNRGIIDFGTVESAVDRYSSALLAQNQCTALRLDVEKLMIGDKLFRDAKLEESSNLYYTGKFIAYENVLELIDAVQPVA